MPVNTYSKHSVPILHRFHLSESAAVYLMQSLRSFGLSLIAIFIPVYLFQIDLDIIFINDELKNSLITVGVFYLFESFWVIFISVFLAPYFFRKLHFKKLLLLSNFVIIFALLLLRSLDIYSFLYFITPALLGLYIVTFWIPYHLFFVEKNSSKEGHYGKNIGKMYFLQKVVTAAGPLIGGFVITFIGFNMLFLFASLVIFSSIFPIMLEIKERHHTIGSGKNIVKNYLLNSRYKFISLGFIGSMFEATAFMIFWPILLILFLSDFSKLGLLTFITLILSSITALIAGKLTDSKNRNVIHAIGCTLTSFFHFLRVFISVPFILYSIDLLDRSVGSIYALPFNAKVYESAHKDNDAQFLIYREITIHAGKIIALILGILIIILSSNWRLLFLIGSLGALLSYSVNFTKRPRRFLFWKS